jgi:hypothetical protein
MDDDSLTELRNLRSQLFERSSTREPSSSFPDFPSESAPSVHCLRAPDEDGSDTEVEERVIPITFTKDDITIDFYHTDADGGRLGDSIPTSNDDMEHWQGLSADGEEVLGEEMAEAGNLKDGETTVALNLCIRSHRSRTHRSSRPEVENVFQLALVPSSKNNGRFISAFLQIKFVSPSGVRVVDFAPKDSQTSKTKIEHEHEIKTSLKATGAVPHDIFSASSTLEGRWLKKFSRVSTSHVTGVLTDSFSDLKFSLREDPTAKSGLDRHHDLFFKLDKHGEIKAEIYVWATLQ